MMPMGDLRPGLRSQVAQAKKRRAQERRKRSSRRLPFVGLLGLLGPGLIAANAGNDAGAVATHSSVGADYGYSLLWVMVLISLPLIVVQEMCARMGAVTGKGLADLIRERFGVRWTTFAMVTLLLANGGTLISEFAGIGAAAELFGISKFIAVPIAGIVLWWLITRGSYVRVERIFLVMTVGFFAYIIAAFMAGPDWGAVARGLVIPTFSTDPAFIFIVIALVGTTITPYMQLFIQSSVVERGADPNNLTAERVDVVVGSLFANAVVIFIQIATAATLFTTGQKVESAADAAMALVPFAGEFAKYLFGIGLFGASMLAAGVLPLATAFAVCDAFGFERGVSRKYDEAPEFYFLFTSLIVFGVVVTLLPIPLITLLLVVQVANGLLLPVVLVFVTRLASDRDVLGKYVTGPVVRVLAWGTTIVVGGLAISLIVLGIILPMLGVRLS